MSAPRVASHFDARGERLLGAVFMTYTLGIRALEDRVLPALLSLRSAPDEPEFAVEVRRRLVETPVVILADAGYLEERGAAAFAGPCRVPVARVRSNGGVFHPKLALLRFEGGVRVVIGSANLTEQGLAENIELVTSFQANDFPETSGSLRRILDAYQGRLGGNPEVKRAFDRVREALPPVVTTGGAVTLLASCDGPILDRCLRVIREDTRGKGTCEAVEIVSPYYERGREEQGLLDNIEEGIRRALPASTAITWTVTLPTRSAEAPFDVEAPVALFRSFAGGAQLGARCTKRRSFAVRVLRPEDRRWIDEVAEPASRAPRALHGKLIRFRIRHRGSLAVYTLIGSPNFTKAALLGLNDEIALLLRTGKSGDLFLGGLRAELGDLREAPRTFDRLPLATACVERVEARVRERTLTVFASAELDLPTDLRLTYEGASLAYRRDGRDIAVEPFDLGEGTVLRVGFGGAGEFDVPIEVADPEERALEAGPPPSVDELLQGACAFASDPDAPPRCCARRRRRVEENAPAAEADGSLHSFNDVAPRLSLYSELPKAVQAALGAELPRGSLSARFAATYAPALRALVEESLAGTGAPARAPVGFVLLDIARVLARIEADMDDPMRREECAQCRREVEAMMRMLRSVPGEQDVAPLRRIVSAFGG